MVLQHDVWLVVIELHQLGSLVVLRHRFYWSGICTGNTCWRSSFSVFRNFYYSCYIPFKKGIQSLSFPNLFLSLPEVGWSQSLDMAWDADWTSISATSLFASTDQDKSFTSKLGIRPGGVNSTLWQDRVLVHGYTLYY